MEFYNTIYNDGDLIVARVNSMPLIYHLGIFADVDGVPCVWHNSPDNTNSFGGSVLCDPLNVFLQSRQIVGIVPTKINSKLINDRIPQLAMVKFDLLNYNCEHFVNDMIGEPKLSPQVQTWLLVIPFLVMFRLIN